HRQSVESRKAHAAVNALSGRQRAQGSTAAEMRDHDPAISYLWRDLSEPPRNVFVREPVKSISAHAFLVEVFRDRIAIGDCRMAPVKGCVETRDLQEMRLALQYDLYGREIVRLMQRGKRNEALKSFDNARGDNGRLAE